MKEEQYIQRLAARARHEVPPQPDMAGRVMAALRERRESGARVPAPIFWLSAFSAAVAIPVALAALAAYETCTDPLMEIVWSLPWGLK